MKQLAMLVGLCLFGWMTWRVGTSLSSDALGLAVGVVFGVLAGIPSALLVLAGQRRRERREYDDDDDDTPVVYITHNNYTDNRQLTINTTPAGGMPLLTDRQREIQAERSGRVFKVVGERAEWDGE